MSHRSSATASPFQTRRYLGLELAGARNAKTALAALEYYPKEGKIFLLEIMASIGSDRREPGDEALLILLGQYAPAAEKFGVSAALTLPPCVTCTRAKCPTAAKCTVPSVKWMRERSGAKSFTPYTQRPVELWVKHQVFPRLNARYHFDIDETLGGNRGPLSGRMDYLRRQLDTDQLIEVLPKLTMAVLGQHLKIPPRIMRDYRSLEVGVHARGVILEHLSRLAGVFLYEKDAKTLSTNLNAFDAFLCAYTALLCDTGHCAKLPKGYPSASGWIDYPDPDGTLTAPV
jgi:hypothetical protein